MYRLATKYTLLGLRHDHDTNSMMLKPIPGVPQDFHSEIAATDWALSNHNEMRHHPEFVVIPVHHMVLTWRPEDESPIR
jgi:hypothetical protein